MNTKQAVAARIRALCAQRGKTINEIANEAGLSPSTVYSMLNNKSKNPGIVTIKKLCDAFENPKITLADFFDTETFRNLEQEME